MITSKGDMYLYVMAWPVIVVVFLRSPLRIIEYSGTAGHLDYTRLEIYYLSTVPPKNCCPAAVPLLSRCPARSSLETGSAQ